MARLSKAKWCLLGGLIAVLMLTMVSVFVPSGLTPAIRWLASSDFAGRLKVLPQPEAPRQQRRVEMVVETVGFSRLDYQPVVLLKEKGGKLYLPISIGLLEANAISVTLEGVEAPRPLTPDLLYAVIQRMGASVDYVVVRDLRDNIFYASIALKTDGAEMEIDARPSDAIAVALRARAPIYVDRAVLDKAGIQSEDKGEKYTARQAKAPS